jgi:hypothetical protein
MSNFGMFRPVMVTNREDQNAKQKYIKIYRTGGLTESEYMYIKF